MNYDEYLMSTPTTFDDELEQCDCCGSFVSPHSINEAEKDFWICNYCFAEWSKEVDNG